MKMPTRQTDRHVGAVLAALDVLECFLVKPGLTTLEIMQATGFTRNRVMRLTGTLTHRGHLMADPETGIFSTGPKIFALGKVFERNRLSLSLVRPILRDIALRTGESASLYVREGFERVVLAREEGTHAIRHAISEGQRMDLHAGAAGKVILAFSPQEIVEAVLAKTGLPKRAAATITSKKSLFKELDTIRGQGYAVSMGERAADVCALAAPVFEHGHELAGALSISGPISRFSPQIRKAHAQLLRADGLKLSRQLGWMPPSHDKGGRMPDDDPEGGTPNDGRKKASA
jgi:IclR family KDG regulon transcriptional repressor